MQSSDAFERAGRMLLADDLESVAIDVGELERLSNQGRVRQASVMGQRAIVLVEAMQLTK